MAIWQTSLAGAKSRLHIFIYSRGSTNPEKFGEDRSFDVEIIGLIETVETKKQRQNICPSRLQLCFVQPARDNEREMENRL